MKNFVSVVLASFCAVLFSCGKRECRIGTFELLHSERTMVDSVSAYYEYVYVPGLSSDCMDSTIISAELNRYVGKVKGRKTIYGFSLLGSKENFDSGESLSQSDQFFDDVVMAVYLDTTTGLPTEFILFGKNQVEIYRGRTWPVID